MTMPEQKNEVTTDQYGVSGVVSYHRYIGNGNYHVLNKHGDMLGSLCRNGVGIYYFWSYPKIGAMSEDELRAIADKLGEENYVQEAWAANGGVNVRGENMEPKDLPYPLRHFLLMMNISRFQLKKLKI